MNTEVQVVEALTKASFTFAKTMPDNPHSYTLRNHWKAEIPFEEVVQYIRDNGYHRMFYSTEYTYFQIGEYEYWTMGDTLRNTRLINKALIKTS